MNPANALVDVRDLYDLHMALFFGALDRENIAQPFGFAGAPAPDLPHDTTLVAWDDFATLHVADDEITLRVRVRGHDPEFELMQRQLRASTDTERAAMWAERGCARRGMA